MAQLRRDPIVGRWIIVDTDHPTRPEDFEKEVHSWDNSRKCPFCYGNEETTPPEIDSIRPFGHKPNTAGWYVRAVANKFPALVIEGNLDRRGDGIYDLSNGIGAHEVIVDSPAHEKNISDLTEQEVSSIITMYVRRYTDLTNDNRFKYIMIFKNYGPSAGASLEHPHSQLIALPMVPKNVSEELHGAASYFDFRGRCIFCDILAQESEDAERIISQNNNFIALCPFVARFPFEVWILPKEHKSCFSLISDNKELTLDLARILREVLLRLKKTLSNPAFNYIIHTSPLYDKNNLSYHWHIEIMPKLTRVAGFEWGTGFYIVPTPPELCAKYLKEIKI